MPSTSKLGRVSRKVAVSLANRTTRKLIRASYMGRLSTIRRRAEADAETYAHSFRGSLLGNAEAISVGDFEGLFVDSADRVLGGSFILFERWFDISPEHSSGEDLWRTDFESGYRFPDCAYTRVSAQNNVADIKLPWELGRMQRLMPVAVAYVVTGERRYLDSFRDIVSGFAAANPLGKGVQWVCTMEVGIRAFNILVAFEAVQQFLEEDDELHTMVACLAFAHAEHIMANLETSARLQENNHYVADLLGLAAVASYYPSHPRSRVWGRYATKELMRCARKQILDDGCCFERSTRYTRLLGEMLFYAGKTLARTEFALPAAYWDRLALLSSFLDAVTDDAGHSPQVGDNDSGRVMPLSAEAFEDLRLCGRLVARERGTLSVDDPALFAEEALIYGAGSRASGIPSRGNHVAVFPDAGMAVARIGAFSLGFLAVDAFDEWSEAGHTHNDKLSFVLSVDGRALLVDPGSGVYTRNTVMRDRLRSTAQHSTLWFEGVEQNDFRGLFGYTRRGGASLRRLHSDSGAAFRAETDCYVATVGCVHARTVEVVDDGVVVSDKLIGSTGGRVATRSFVLGPNVSLRTIDERSIYMAVEGTEALLTSNAPIKVRTGFYSPRYGDVEETRILDTSYEENEENVVRITKVKHAD